MPLLVKVGFLVHVDAFVYVCAANLNWESCVTV